MEKPHGSRWPFAAITAAGSQRPPATQCLTPNSMHTLALAVRSAPPPAVSVSPRSDSRYWNRGKGATRPARRAGQFHCVHQYSSEPSRSGARHVEHLGFADLDCSGPLRSSPDPSLRSALTWGVDTFVDVHTRPLAASSTGVRELRSAFGRPPLVAGGARARQEGSGFSSERPSAAGRCRPGKPGRCPARRH